MSLSGSEKQELRQQLQQAVGLHQAGNLAEAERIYEHILERLPTQAETLSFLGVIKADKRENDRAIELLRRAVQFKPEAANILNNLGRVLLSLKRYEEATEVLARAVAATPPLPEAIANLAQAHRGAGNIDEALYYLDVLKDRGIYSRAAELERATILSDLGRKGEALAIVRGLISAKPGFGPAWLLLVQLKEFGPADQEGDQVIALAEEATDGAPAKKALCYAAGKVLDDRRDFEKAFECFTLATRQGPIDFNIEETRARFDALRNLFDADYFITRADYGVTSERPVFVVGMPRSGTTLAEQILSAHDDVYGGGELEYIGQLFNAARDYVPEGQKPQAMQIIDAPAVHKLASQYLRKIDAHDNRARYFIDKMPNNFMYIGFIKLMFPNAKIIHCLRHPLDTCLSCYMRDFAFPHGYNQSLEGLASYYNLYRELMAYWAELFGDDIFELQYEALVTHPEKTSRELSAFLGLPWQGDILATDKNQRRVATPSNWQVRKPIYTSAAGKWKAYEQWLLPGLSGIKDDYLASCHF